MLRALPETLPNRCLPCLGRSEVPHGGVSIRHATALETLSLDLPEAAVPAYEAALQSVCGTVGFFLDDATGLWRIEGVKQAGADEGALRLALLLAETATGAAAVLHRAAVPADGWLARTRESFPEQLVGRRFALRGTHLPAGRTGNRLTLRIDAGVAFGSGEHGSTRGCLRALERVATGRRIGARRRAVLDLGTGSGVLAMAAALLLRGRVLASDIDPWSVRTTRDNVRLNRLGGRVRCVRADGWNSRAIRQAAPLDLVLANILARPLCAMAAALAARLAPGGTAILSGLLASQARLVLAAHRRVGLVLERTLRDGDWVTLILRRRF